MTDERTQDTPLNVNEQIQDRTIAHMVFLERFKNGEVNRIRRTLDRDILPEIERKIERRIARIAERGSDLGPVTTQRLRDLERELRTLTDDLASQVRNASIVDLTDLTRDELNWQVNVIREELGFNIDFVVPAARSVAATIKRSSFAGQTLDQWYDSLSRATQRSILSQVNRGIVEGETTAQILRRIRGTRAGNFRDGVWNTTRNQAETLTRSTINHVSNQARIELFKENSDIIRGLQYTATLDSRTSVICAGLDGNVYPVDQGPRPPVHPNCRSTMTAVLKSWRSLGLTGLDEGTRASINGQVPRSTTYGAWLRRQPLAVQQEVLGVTKARLFRDGNLDISRFTNNRLRPLTLDELRNREQNAFQAAQIDL